MWGIVHKNETDGQMDGQGNESTIAVFLSKSGLYIFWSYWVGMAWRGPLLLS